MNPEKKENYLQRENSDAKIVAIVGAGFSGLVLANYLELRAREHEERQQSEEGIDHPKNPLWTYKLFESKSSSGIPIIGTILLKSARRILEELCLFEAACCGEQGGLGPIFPRCTHSKSESTTNAKKDNYQEVSRESFLELLRKNVKIQSSSRVVDVIETSPINGSLRNNNNPNYFIIATEGDGRERTEHGPFDLVVAANGLSFRGETTKILEEKLKFSSSIVRIGDCRYRYNRSWWDCDFLGATRRKSGADVAIQDGLLIGRRLWQCDPFHKQEEQHSPRFRLRDGVTNGNGTLQEIFPLSFQNDRKISYHGKLLELVWVTVVILLPIIVALSLYYC